VRLLCQPLLRLLAVNIAAGASVAVLMLGGLLALNPYGLRGLILSDRAGGVALALLLFGFLITFGSAAMGTAIMTLGKKNARAAAQAARRNRRPRGYAPSAAPRERSLPL
jgi:hypothetical protein